MDSNQVIRDVCRKHGVTVAYLFGSRAHATARPGSDHDVAVLFAGSPSLLEIGALQSALVTALGTAVDLVELQRATLELRAEVVQRGCLVYSDDEPARVRFEVDTRSRWFDYRPVLQKLTTAYLRHVATQGL